MNNHDATPIKSFSEVEKRLTGMYRNLVQTESRIVRINNELASISKSLLINLSEYMNQGEVALWFFSGTPTLENEPYIDWQDVSEHAGDFYYDRSKGVVYQFNGQNWIILNDEELVEAMAITNADMLANNHERKLFIDQPNPPYQTGDWWIKENGDLYICIVDVESESTFSESDFVSSNLYSLTVTNKTVNDITIMKNMIYQITDTYVRFIDLNTIGNSEVVGENLQTFRQQNKKDIEVFNNAIDIVKDTDIYKYHFQTQETTDKKYIGFIIDTNTNYSNNVVTEDNHGNSIGIDLYSMVSILWQAVKEQQDEIENLREGYNEN